MKGNNHGEGGTGCWLIQGGGAGGPQNGAIVSDNSRFFVMGCLSSCSFLLHIYVWNFGHKAHFRGIYDVNGYS